MPGKAKSTMETTKSTEIPKEDHHIQDFKAQAAKAEAQGDWKKAAKYYAHGLEQRAVELALINSVQEGLSSKYEMQAIYDLVGDKLRATFNAQIVMISQYDSQTNKIFNHYAIERGQHLHIPEKMQVVPGTEVPKTWLGVPLLVAGEARGIVSLQNLDIENAFSTSDIDLLSTLTNSMSQSLENARLFNETQRLLNQMEREMGLARQAQKSILPTRSPKQPGYDFGSLIIPALAVGGDFYDFIPLDNQRLCISIGDVSDKGLRAALFMAVTFSLVRVETGRSNNQRKILENVNKFLLKMNAKMFVTLLYCVLDFKTGNLRYSRAGHLPPIVIDQDGKIVDIPMEEGQPLGVFDKLNVDQQQFTIPNGGLALLLSDGLHEAVDSFGKFFGFDRVREILIAHRHERANTICKKLLQAVQNHSGEFLHQDDFTTVVVKRN